MASRIISLSSANSTLKGSVALTAINHLLAHGDGFVITEVVGPR